MTLFRIIHEAVPVIRDADRLTDDHPLRPYPPLHPIRASLWLRGILFAALVVAVVMVYIGVYVGITGDFAGTGGYIHTFLSQLFAVVLAYLLLVLAMEGRRPPFELAPSRLAGLGKGMLLGLAAITVVVGILAMIGVYRIESFNPAYNPWETLLAAGVVAGVSEELAFRGVLFRLLEEGIGTWGAAGLSGLVFGLMHMGNDHGTLWGGIAIAIEAGILFSAVYALTRSLWWVIGLHFAWNVTQGPVFGSVISGTSYADGWIVSSWTGPEILTGGTFGLEASIVTVVVLGAVGIGALVYAQIHHLTLAPIWVRKRMLRPPAPASPEPDADPAEGGEPDADTPETTEPKTAPAKGVKPKTAPAKDQKAKPAPTKSSQPKSGPTKSAPPKDPPAKDEKPKAPPARNGKTGKTGKTGEPDAGPTT